MRWALRKIDSLLATLAAAVAGLAAAQLDLFIQFYLQRLGGHLDEARLTLRLLLDGRATGAATAAARQMMADVAQARVAELAASHDAIAGAGLVSRPVLFFLHMDRDIAVATAKAFQPGLPLDTAGIAYGVAGMVLALLIYDLARSLLAVPFRRRPARSLHEP